MESMSSTAGPTGERLWSGRSGTGASWGRVDRGPGSCSVRREPLRLRGTLWDAALRFSGRGSGSGSGSSSQRSGRVSSGTGWRTVGSSMGRGAPGSIRTHGGRSPRTAAPRRVTSAGAKAGRRLRSSRGGTPPVGASDGVSFWAPNSDGVRSEGLGASVGGGSSSSDSGRSGRWVSAMGSRRSVDVQGRRGREPPGSGRSARGGAAVVRARSRRTVARVRRPSPRWGVSPEASGGAPACRLWGRR